MTLALLAGLILVAALAVFVVYPLVASRRERETLLAGSADQQLENLLFEREVTLAAIRDLQFDRAMGKLSDDDFQELDARYRRRAVEIMQRLDALGVTADEREEDLEAALDRWIEQAVASARAAARAARTPPAGSAAPQVCNTCGRAARAGDRFCAACGTPLRVESPAPS